MSSSQSTSDAHPALNLPGIVEKVVLIGDSGNGKPGLLVLPSSSPLNYEKWLARVERIMTLTSCGKTEMEIVKEVVTAAKDIIGKVEKLPVRRYSP